MTHRLATCVLALLAVGPSLARADDGCVQQGSQQQCRKSTFKNVVKPGETLEAIVKCPVGTMVSGGGHNVSTNLDSFAVASSSPLADGSGWYVSAVNHTDETASTTLEAVALCR